MELLMQINNNSFHGKLCMSEAMLGFIRSKNNKELKVGDLISFNLSIRNLQTENQKVSKDVNRL